MSATNQSVRIQSSKKTIALICLTCPSVPVEVPPRALWVNGLDSDVVRHVGAQILQPGVVSVPGNRSLRITAAQSQVS